MSNSPTPSEKQSDGQSAASIDSADTFRCPLPVAPPGRQRITSVLNNGLAGAVRPLDVSVQERLRFETVLANLSATFVNVAANEINSHIESGLKQIVELLDLDRSGLGEMTAEGMMITHSYQVPGVPPSPRVILDAQFPFYAKKIYQGEVVRLPDDLPAEATNERNFCLGTGLKSNLTIPLKVTGSVVGGIGFASFRSTREWPDELVQRLRLVGDIFTNALARKRAHEALILATQQATALRNELAHATRLELVSHLTTSIAHEVNQPLYAISSNAQTALDLLSMGDIEEAKNALKDIWADAHRASEVIGRVRSMVRKDEPRRSSIVLAELIEELAPLLYREAAGKGAALRIKLEAGDAAVVCDRVQLQQVLLNLLLNAVDAVSEAEAGLREVLIRTWNEDACWARVTFEDTGPGLTQDACERVFAPFFTTKPKGLGLGLSISRSLVEAHGGQLWAVPRAERGTLFHMQLPRAAKGQS